MRKRLGVRQSAGACVGGASGYPCESESDLPTNGTAAARTEQTTTIVTSRMRTAVKICRQIGKGRGEESVLQDNVSIMRAYSTLRGLLFSCWQLDVSRAAAILRFRVASFSPLLIIGQLFLPISGNLYSQSTPYGLKAMFNHKATLIKQNMVEDKDEVNMPPTQTTSYNYDYHFLSAYDPYGLSESGFKAAISPGTIRSSWDGASSVASGVGNPNAGIYSRSDLFALLGWNDSITVTSPHYARGTEVFVHFSHYMHADVLKANAYLRIRRWAEFNNNWEQKSSELDTSVSHEIYRVIALRTRIGDTITYNMETDIVGSMYNSLGSGELTPIDSAASSFVKLGGFGSDRIGIRTMDTNVVLTSASGYTYPIHALSSANVLARLEGLVIKKFDYTSNLGAISFIVEAIPGASYVLQRSIGRNLQGWADVGTPKIPLDFGELTLTDSFPPEPSSFWRIAATPLP